MLQDQATNSIENLVTICWTINNIFHVIRPVALNIEFPFLYTYAVEIQMAECQQDQQGTPWTNLEHKSIHLGILGTLKERWDSETCHRSIIAFAAT